MSAQLFDRALTLTLSKPTGFFSQGGDTVVISDHRVEFSIEKNLAKSPNKCRITITNLSEQSRAEFEKTPLHVRIDAGYDGQPQRLFAGDLTFGQSSQEGADWRTELQIADGERAFRRARVNRSYSSAVTYRALVTEIAKAMGLEVPSSAAEFAELDKQLVSGVALFGQASDQMTAVLSSHDLEWSIQDGKLQILGSNARPDIREISAKTGLVGSPRFGTPENARSKKRPTLHFRTLLYPSLVPGGKVRIESRSVRGLYRLERVVHEGDTRGQSWYSECEAKPL